MNTSKIRLTELQFADYNPRRISETEYNKLSNSIREFGLVDPIIINLKNNRIIGGHQRCQVLLDQYTDDLIEEPEFTLIRLGDIGFCFFNEELIIKDENHEKALNLALNKISGEWDEVKLQPLLEELELSGLNIELTGFNEIELKDFNMDLNNEESTTVFSEEIPDDEPEFDETIADNIQTIKCPKCGYELPK